MRLPSLFCICILCFGTAASAQDTPLSRAMVHVRADDWGKARAAARPAGQLALDVVTWRWLRAGQGEFPDYRDFLARNGDWPGLERLRERGEATLTDAVPADQVLEYFAPNPPQTGEGALQRIRAWREKGNAEDALADTVAAWRSLSMSDGARSEFLQAAGDVLSEHHEARLDMLLWRGLTDDAKAMLSLVGDGWRALARARIALREDESGVDALIDAVPDALSDDAGLAYERFLWRIRKGRRDDALAMMETRSDATVRLGQPERWANWRRILARNLMRDGDGARAYRLASTHYLGGGSDYADLEWLSGYIALTRLDDAEAARRHFRRFRAEVFTPISLGRAGYWEGRAEEALGNTESARAAYAFGGEYQTSFYGLLAAERAGLPMDKALIGNEVFPDWREAAFADTPLVKTAVLLLAAGERNLAEWFLVHLAESLDPVELGQLADFALSLKEPHLALKIAKQAAQQGVTLPRAYYPLHTNFDAGLPVPPELALSIARRESEFDPVVISPAGARGMMQVMPGTARDMASALDIPYDGGRLLSDAAYNLRLGSAYLNGLIKEFGPSYVLVAAGYNAGPGRPRQWISERGDPRSDGVDPIDWIEQIPFRETRNYVMRVMESLPVYRARLSGEVAPLNLSQELRRTP